MLQELLEILNEHPGPINPDQICDRLGIPPSGLQPLLDILVRKGRVVPISPEGLACSGRCRTCPALLRCNSGQTSPELLLRVRS